VHLVNSVQVAIVAEFHKTGCYLMTGSVSEEIYASQYVDKFKHKKMERGTLGKYNNFHGSLTMDCLL
jgi:hypothetical protein